MALQDQGSALRMKAVTPSDTVAVNCRALYVGGAGNVVGLAVNDTVVVTLTAVPAGTLLPVAMAKVMAATTATGLVALF